MCVCRFGVQIRVDYALVQNDHGVQEGYPICGPLCCKLDGRVERVYLLKKGLQFVLSPVPDGEDVVNVSPPYAGCSVCPSQ